MEYSIRNHMIHEKIYLFMKLNEFIGTNFWIDRSSFEASLCSEKGKFNTALKNRKICEAKKNLFSPSDTFLSVKRFSFPMCTSINFKNASGIHFFYTLFEDARVLSFPSLFLTIRHILCGWNFAFFPFYMLKSLTKHFNKAIYRFSPAGIYRSLLLLSVFLFNGISSMGYIQYVGADINGKKRNNNHLAKRCVRNMLFSWFNGLIFVLFSVIMT